MITEKDIEDGKEYPTLGPAYFSAQRMADAALAGTKNHMRMWCDTPGCSMEMME